MAMSSAVGMVARAAGGFERRGRRGRPGRPGTARPIDIGRVNGVASKYWDGIVRGWWLVIRDSWFVTRGSSFVVGESVICFVDFESGRSASWPRS